MKLLFDQSLSFRLVAALSDHFPRSAHVRQHGLSQAMDSAIWRFARDHGYAIVTLDSDFVDLSALRGWPPKIVWLRSADTSTQAILELLRRSASEIESFLTDESKACLIVGNR